MAGYSKNPLWKKLGIKEGQACFLYQPPVNYFDLLIAIPEETTWDKQLPQIPYDFMHVFVLSYTQLQDGWNMWKTHLKKDGSLWISWPKGTSKLTTDLNGNLVRKLGLDGGLVDVKVCAVDDDWSGLKFMYRKQDR